MDKAMKPLKAWAVIYREGGKIVNWRSEPDGEEGLEIHRTRRLAKGAAFKGEKVVPVVVRARA